MLSKVVVGSATLGCISAVRQGLGVIQQTSAVSDPTTSLLQEMQEQGWTPNLQEKFAGVLQTASAEIASKVQPMIKASQVATQTKIDNAVSAMQGADTAATQAKQAADAADSKMFQCIAAEQAKRKVVEDAEQSLTTSRSNEKEACQIQQDNKGFAWAAQQKGYGFACDLSTDGHCAGELGSFKTKLESLKTEAAAALAAGQKKYSALKATCDDHAQRTVKAQSALTSAESAWAAQLKTCRALAAPRSTALCDYGTKVQSKCAAETSYNTLIAATKKAKGDDLSEPDRAEEWKHASVAKCMIGKAISKGTQSALDSADLQACAAEVDFSAQVGNLDRKEAIAQKLASSHQCADGAITFSNGQAWTVPTGAKPKSSEYVKSQFTPTLTVAGGAPFAFCGGAAGVATNRG